MSHLFWGLSALTLAAAATRPVKICTSPAPHYAYDQGVTWAGTLSSEQKTTSPEISTETGHTGRALILQLDAPISAISQGTALDSECDQRRVQLSAAGELQAQAAGLVGKRVRITGSLQHAYTQDQLTPLVVSVQTIEAEPPPKP